MRIAVISECSEVPSGFGKQARMLCEDLHMRGNDVWMLGAGRVSSERAAYQELLLNYNDCKMLESYCSQLNFDWLIFLSPIYLWESFFASALTRDVKFLFWFPYEGCVYKPEFVPWLEVCGNGLIHLSEYHNRMWEPHIGQKTVIPHGVDLSLYRPVEVDRKKWQRRLGFLDEFVILNMDRNTWRKRWDLCFDMLARLKERGLPVTLVAHTSVYDEATQSPDLRYFAREYGVDDMVVFTGFEWAKGLQDWELNELINLADVRVSCSMAEGFGCLTTECMAAKTLNIIPNNTTASDILGDTGVLVDCPSRAFYYGCFGAVPSVEGMVDSVVWAFENREGKRIMEELAFQRVVGFERGLVCNQFLEKMRSMDNYSEERQAIYECNEQRRAARSYVYSRIAHILTQFKSVDFIDVKHGEDVAWAAQKRVPVQARADSVKWLSKKAVPFVRECPIEEFPLEGSVLFAGRFFERHSETISARVMETTKATVLFTEHNTDPYSHSVDRRVFRTDSGWDEWLKSFGFVRRKSSEVLINVGCKSRVQVYQRRGHTWKIDCTLPEAASGDNASGHSELDDSQRVEGRADSGDSSR